MSQNDENIKEVQELVNNEFDKAFKIKFKNNNYTLALSNDDIPIVKSCILDNHRIQIFFVDHLNPNRCKNEVSNKFIIIEDCDGNIQAASLDFTDLIGKNNFKYIRKEIEPIYNYYENEKSISELINLEKKKKLLHALYDIIIEFLDKSGNNSIHTQRI